MTESDAIVYQAAHLFAQTELNPELAMPGLHTVEQTQAMLSTHLAAFRLRMAHVLRGAGVSPTRLVVPEQVWVVLAEHEAIIPEEQIATTSANGLLSEAEVASEGESADDFNYTDVPLDIDGLLAIRVTDILSSRRVLEPLFAGKDEAVCELLLTESALALEVWMGLGSTAFEGLDPRRTTDGPTPDTFTRLAKHMGLPAKSLEFTGGYNPRVRDMLIAARQRFAGSLAYQGVQYAADRNLPLDSLSERDINLLKAVHRSLFDSQVRSGHYKGDLRQFALARPLRDAELVETIQILAN